MAGQSFGKEGYHIHLKNAGVKDSMVFLAHYYGVNSPKYSSQILPILKWRGRP